MHSIQLHLPAFAQRFRSVSLVLLSLLSITAFFSLFPGSANAAARSNGAIKQTCLQAPANLDPTTLNTAQLMAYGLPLHQTKGHISKRAKSDWLQTANRIKHDRHICSLPELTGFLAHPSTGPRPNVTQYLAPAFAGNFATGSPGDYTYSSATWNLPCMNTSVRNARASFWVGLGGFGRSGYLVQAGTDVIVDGNGHVSYTGWIESTMIKDYLHSFGLPNGRCGNQMYVEADSFTSSDYYVVDGGGQNYSAGENWPTTVGDTAECMVERLHNSSNGAFYDLANFNYLAFTNCYAGYNSIGNDPHNYYVMSENGIELAGPGPISSDGLAYNVNWFHAHG